MAPPQVVVFDLGKVLLDFDYMLAARKLAAHSKVGAEVINQLINQSSLLLRYERGQMTASEFFAEVVSATGFQGDLEEFAPLFGDIFCPMPPMIELHAAVQKQAVPAFIFSNTNDLAVTYIRRTFPFFGRFDGYIFSYEQGAMKPEAKMYEAVERKTGCHREQILYVDDRAENIAAGAARGWQVVLQETPEKTLAAFRKTGLPV